MNKLTELKPNIRPTYSEDSQGCRNCCWCTCHAKTGSKEFQKRLELAQKKLESSDSPNITMKRVTAENKDITKSKAFPSTIPLSGFSTFQKETVS